MQLSDGGIAVRFNCDHRQKTMTQLTYGALCGGLKNGRRIAEIVGAIGVLPLLYLRRILGLTDPRVADPSKSDLRRWLSSIGPLAR